MIMQMIPTNKPSAPCFEGSFQCFHCFLLGISFNSPVTPASSSVATQILAQSIRHLSVCQDVLSGQRAGSGGARQGEEGSVVKNRQSHPPLPVSPVARGGAPRYIKCLVGTEILTARNAKDHNSRNARK